MTGYQKLKEENILLKDALSDILEIIGGKESEEFKRAMIIAIIVPLQRMYQNGKKK